jgi:site-specific recombinase XerD
VCFERRTLHLFLRHLRQEGVTRDPVPPPDSSPAAALERGYVAHLREERGLAERSILVYRPHARAFLARHGGRIGAPPASTLKAHHVREFLLARLAGRSVSYSFLLASALRSFLRFLFLRGRTASDLGVSVPPVRRWRAAPLPSFLSPPEIDRVLATPDRSTPTGRRDHAVLLLLARLGLRAGEVVTLELGDIRWRAGEILIRGKGRSLNRLPLLSEVGQAISLYLRRGRGAAASRRVVLSRRPPCVGLVGPASVGHIVRLALRRAGLNSPVRRGAAHLFRHGLATRMIRHGASMQEIAEVLRHQSPSTTEIYAHVAVEALRGVAMPWPAAGCAR